MVSAIKSINGQLFDKWIGLIELYNAIKTSINTSILYPLGLSGQKHNVQTPCAWLRATWHHFGGNKSKKKYARTQVCKQSTTWQ